MCEVFAGRLLSLDKSGYDGINIQGPQSLPFENVRLEKLGNNNTVQILQKALDSRRYNHTLTILRRLDRDRSILRDNC